MLAGWRWKPSIMFMISSTMFMPMSVCAHEQKTNHWGIYSTLPQQIHVTAFQAFLPQVGFNGFSGMSADGILFLKSHAVKNMHECKHGFCNLDIHNIKPNRACSL